METVSIRTLVLGGAVTLLLAVASVVTGPEPLEAEDCDGAGQVICKENESCVNILFYQQCTTEYEYYEGDEEEDEDEEETDPDDEDGSGDGDGDDGDGDDGTQT